MLPQKRMIKLNDSINYLYIRCLACSTKRSFFSQAKKYCDGLWVNWDTNKSEFYKISFQDIHCSYCKNLLLTKKEMMEIDSFCRIANFNGIEEFLESFQ